MYNNSLPDPEFKRAEILAKELRMLQTSTSLSLNVLFMEFDRYIYFDTFENYSNICGVDINTFTLDGKLKDGYTIRLAKNKNLVLYYEKSKSTPRLNWTLAHEIGHIYLNHNCDEGTQEVEANFFAAELLMPTVIVTRLARKISLTPNIISKTFFVSPDAAKRKIQTLNRGGRGSTYLRRDILDKYQDPLNDLIEFYQNKNHSLGINNTLAEQDNNVNCWQHG